MQQRRNFGGGALEHRIGICIDTDIVPVQGAGDGGLARV